MLRSIPGRRFDLAILLLVAIALAAAVGGLIHFSAPGAPARITLLRDIIAGRSVAYTPYPLGYFEFAGHLMRWNERYGLAVGQAALYVTTVLLAWSILRQLGAQGVLPLAGALLVAFYPSLLLSIPKFQDTGISCFFMVFFAWLVVRLKRDGLSPGNAVIAGVFFGAVLLVRSNALSLAPVALWAAFYGRRVTGRSIALAVASLVSALAVIAAINIPAKGSLSVFDRYYGAYSLVCNTHPLALEGVWKDYNGESLLPAALSRMGLPYQGLNAKSDAFADEYMQVASQFVREHPLRYLELEAAKAITFFRPDMRNTERSSFPRAIFVPVQIGVAAIFFAWLYLRWRTGTLNRFNEGFYCIPLFLFYIAPFIAISAEPRYRFPIDPLLIIDSVLCVQALYARSHSAPLNERELTI